MSRVTVNELAPRQKVVATMCDVCSAQADGDEPKGWHHFSHGHSDWGNDSIDSFEYFDACSVECFATLISKSLEQYGDHRGFRVNDMGAEFARKLMESIERTNTQQP